MKAFITFANLRSIEFFQSKDTGRLFFVQMSVGVRVRLIATAFAWGCHVVAAEPADFAQWLSKRLETAPAAERLSNIKLRWTEWSYSKLTDDQFAQMKRDVVTDPSDDRKFAIGPEELFRKAPNGAVPTEITVWWKDEKSWRFSYTYPTITGKDGSVVRPASFDDRIATPETTWQLTPDSLLVANPVRHADSAQSVQMMFTTVRSQLGMLVDAGLSSRMVKARVQSTREINDEWEAVVAGEIAEVRLMAKWDASLSTFTVRSLRYVRHPDASRKMGGWDFAGWRALPAGGNVIAGQATEVAADGRTMQRLVFDSASEVSGAEFSRVSAVPSPTGEDPVRGALTVRSVYDYVGGEYKEKKAGSASDKGSWSSGEVLKDASDDMGRLRLAGWSVLIVLGASFVGLKVWRWRRA